jgi:alkylhydroperoxidase family enzyme
MFRLKTTPAGQLTGKAAELFAMFPPQIGVPEPLLLMSTSPGLLAMQAQAIEFYRNHPDLDFPMLAAIRLLLARHLGAQACIDFNTRLLLAAGLSAEEVEALPEAGAFTPAQRALLAFALKAVSEPGSVVDADIAALRTQGWSDTTIYDAVAHGASMQVPAVLLRAFTA